MNERTQIILEQARALPEKDRAELAAELMATLQPSLSEWETEISARVAAYDKGELPSENAKDVLAQARSFAKS